MILAALRGWFARDALIGWLPVAVVFVVGAALSLWSNHVLRVDRDLVVHSHEAIEAGQALLIGMADAETGQRGYVITGAQAYLAPYDEGRAKAGAALGRLEALVSDNPAQKARIARLRALAADKTHELDAVIAARAGGFEAARAMVANDAGKRTMDAIRAAIAEVDGAEAALLAIRKAEVRRDEIRAVVVGGAIALASVATRIAVARVRRRRSGAQG